MEIELSIHFEIFRTLMFFAAFWLFFYKLHYQESKTRRILLVLCMVLYRPLLSIIVYNPFFQLPGLFEILFSSVLIAVLALLAGGGERAVWITAIYFFAAIVFIDTISTAMVLGLSGRLDLPNRDLYFYGIISPYLILFLAALVYYLIMRSAPGDVLDRIPLPVWLVILLIPPAGATVFYIAMDSLFLQLEAGYNNFLFLGLSLLSLPILSLVIFFLFKKLISGYSARLLATELNKTPLVFSPESGLSREFVEENGLTEREAEVAEALLRGQSYKDIAVSLDIAVNTVQVHLQNIYRKTGASGRYALLTLTGLKKEQKTAI
jgi:DNA-binding CsgD family transcriptional regulator